MSACSIASPDTVNNFAASSLATLLEMVRADLGVTFIPEMAIRAGRLKGTGIATRTIRGILATATGNITITDQANTGESCTVVVTGSGTTDGNAIVTHTDSGIRAKASFTSADLSGTGGSPSK